MQKIMALISLSLINFSSYALELERALNGFRAFHQTTLLQPPQLQCAPQASFTPCIEAICGTAESTKNDFEMYQEVADNAPVKSNYDTIFPWAVNYYTKKIAMNLDKLARLQELISGNDDLTIPDDLKLAQAFYFLLSHFYYIINPGDLTHKVPEDIIVVSPKTEEDVRRYAEDFFNPEIIGRFTDALNEFTASSDLSPIYYTFFFGAPSMLFARHPGKPLRDILEQEVPRVRALEQAVRREVRPIESHWGKIPSMLPNVQIIETILHEENPSESLVGDFVEASLALEMIHRVLVRKEDIEKMQALQTASYRDYYRMPAMLEKINTAIAQLESLRGQLVFSHKINTKLQTTLLVRTFSFVLIP